MLISIIGIAGTFMASFFGLLSIAKIAFRDGSVFQGVAALFALGIAMALCPLYL